VWAAFVFLGMGVILFLVGLAGIALAIVALLGRGRLEPIEIELGVGLAVLGILVVRHGFRSLSKPGTQ
jgi:hypothetical protein